MYGFDPFKNFEEFSKARDKYDFHAKYHRACINAYFGGTMKIVRIKIECVCEYVHYFFIV